MLSTPDEKPYKQIYPDDWLEIRNKIHADDKLPCKSSCIDLLLLLQRNTNYRTGEVLFNIPLVMDYLNCSRSTAYKCMQWFKDNGVVHKQNPQEKLMVNAQVNDNKYYGKSGILWIAPGLLRLQSLDSIDESKHYYASHNPPAKPPKNQSSMPFEYNSQPLEPAPIASYA
jgi:hypothetical protein